MPCLHFFSPSLTLLCIISTGFFPFMILFLCNFTRWWNYCHYNILCAILISFSYSYFLSEVNLIPLKKTIGKLKDFNLKKKNPTKVFEIKDWIISYPFKFIWNEQSYRDFWSKLTLLISFQIASMFWLQGTWVKRRIFFFEFRFCTQCFYVLNLWL